ncbi:hypothetical protein BDV10DRAFT_60567 [Aspergillus recurvatus]
MAPWALLSLVPALFTAAGRLNSRAEGGQRFLRDNCGYFAVSDCVPFPSQPSSRSVVCRSFRNSSPAVLPALRLDALLRTVFASFTSFHSEIACIRVQCYCYC